MNRCDECKYKDDCIGIPYGCEAFEIDLAVHDAKVRADAIDEYMSKLCDKCIQTPNECWILECPFADDECQIIKVAEELKEQNK